MIKFNYLCKNKQNTNMQTVFSGKIYKLIYSIGGSEFVYVAGAEMKGTGIIITRIENDAEYLLSKQGTRVIVYAKKINGGDEFIYDEIYNAQMSLRRDFNRN